MEIAAEAAVCVPMSRMPPVPEEIEVTPLSEIDCRRYLSCTIAADDEVVPATDVSGAARLSAVRNAPDQNVRVVSVSTPVMSTADVPALNDAAVPALLAIRLVPTRPMPETAVWILVATLARVSAAV